MIKGQVTREVEFLPSLQFRLTKFSPQEFILFQSPAGFLEINLNGITF